MYWDIYQISLVLEYCIDKLGQNCVIPHCDFLISDRKKTIFGRNLSKILTKSLEILYNQECANESDSNTISTIDIVVGGDYVQGKFRSICKFILRDINVKNLNSYVRKNAHIDCKKDIYDVLN